MTSDWYDIALINAKTHLRLLFRDYSREIVSLKEDLEDVVSKIKKIQETKLLSSKQTQQAMLYLQQQQQQLQAIQQQMQQVFKSKFLKNLK